MNVASTATSESVPHASGKRAQDARRLHRRPGFHGKLDVDGSEVATGGDFVGSHCTVVLGQFLPKLWCLDVTPSGALISRRKESKMAL